MEVLKENRFFVMGLAMISIMLYHQPWTKECFFDFYARTGELGVELFLFISGYGIYHSLQKNSLKVYYRNRIMRLMPTCIIIGASQVLLEQIGIKGGSDNPVAHIMMCIGLFKWYIYAIICYYTIAPLLKRVIKHNIYTLLLYAFWLLTSYYCIRSNFLEDSGNVFLTTLPVIIYRFSAFLAGMWFAAHKKVGKNLYVILLGPICYGITIATAYQIISSPFAMIIKYTSFILAIPMLLLLFNIMTQLFRRCYLYTPIEWIGICSLEVYLWHDFFFRAFSNSVALSNTFIQITCSLIATFFCTNIGRLIIKKISL